MKNLSEFVDVLEIKKEEVLEKSKNGDFRWGLPLLEYSLYDVQSTVPSWVQEKLFSTALFALKWPTTYWVDLALDWLADGLQISDESLEVLKRVMANKRYDQSCRHKAKALYHKHRRE